MLPKGLYKLVNDITFDAEDGGGPDALEGDEFKYLNQLHLRTLFWG